MNLTVVRDLLKEVVEAGRMTPVAKEKLHEAYNMVNERVERDVQRDELREEGLQLGYGKTKSIIREMTSAMSVFCRYPKEHNVALDDIKSLEGAIQDLTHTAEYSTQLGLTDEEKLEKWNKLEAVTNERRDAKKFVEATKPIKALITKYPNIQKDMKTAMAQIREVDSVQESRCYTPKTLTSMADAFHKIAPVKENGKIVIKEAN